jgi:hypothetical protein
MKATQEQVRLLEAPKDPETEPAPGTGSHSGSFWRRLFRRSAPPPAGPRET